jgi:hypothetical protein
MRSTLRALEEDVGGSGGFRERGEAAGWQQAFHMHARASRRNGQEEKRCLGTSLGGEAAEVGRGYRSA